MALSCSASAERAPRVASPVASAFRPKAGSTDVGPAAGTTSEGPAATLVEPGTPPHELLRYDLASDYAREFRIEQRLTLFDGDEQRASVEVQAPLSIVTEAADAEAYALRLQLGPARITREGDGEAIGWGSRERSNDSAEARLVALARLTRSGLVREARIVDHSGSELVPLYETLLNLDAPPSQAVGAGARWRTESNHRGSARTKTEYELLELNEGGATFRVQRQQVAGDDPAGVRAFGEWTFTPKAWPPTGYDQTSAKLPESGPEARLSVRFEVTSSRGAVHSRTKFPAP